MNYRILLFVLLLSISFLNANSQYYTGDKILQLNLHPLDSQKFIVKLFSKSTLQLSELWEMGASVSDIDENNYNDLLQRHLIFPNGKCYRLYSSTRVKAEVPYVNGQQHGEKKGYYLTGETMFTSTPGDDSSIKTDVFFKNGKIRKTQFFPHPLPNWEENAFYENEQKKWSATYENNKLNGRYQSFYKNGKTLRKARFEKDELLSSTCYDENGNEIACPDFSSPPTYPGGLEAIKKELENIDWSFNQTNTDTLTFRLVLDIDTLGQAKLEMYRFRHSDCIEPIINEWLATLNDFTAFQYDGFPRNSYLDLSFPVCSNRIIWFDACRSGFDMINTSWNPEKKPCYFLEFPSPASDEVFFIVDNMPEFSGDSEALRRYLANRVQYPMEALQKGIQGTVYVSFIIEKDGSVSSAKIIKSVHPVLDREALRVIRNMPTWQHPGTHRGKPVRVAYTAPINFELRWDK